MAQNIIFALVIIFLIAGAFFWMWKLSKWLVIPIQIILFVLLIIVVIKVFVTKDNAERLNQELNKSGIAEIEQKIISGTVDTLKDRHGKNSSDTAKVQPQSPRTEHEKATPQKSDVPENKPQQTAPAVENKKTESGINKELNFVDMF